MTVLWFGSAAHAWNGSGVDWTWQGAPVDEAFELDADSFSAIASADEAEDVFVAALRTWTVESEADLFLEYGGRATGLPQGGGDDGHDIVAFGSTDRFAGLAVATTWEGGRGDLVDCDITVHRRNGYGTIDWHVGSGSAPYGSYDLANTLTHELGHCLGLAHSQFADALMTPYVSSGLGERERHLTPDDRSGIQALYGAVAPSLELLDASADGAVEGGIATISAVVVNTGDGSAFDVTLDANGETTALGDVGSDTPVGRRVGPDAVTVTLELPVDCHEDTVRIELSLADARGRTWDLAADVPVDCPEPPPEEEPTGDTAAPQAEPTDTGGESEPTPKSGCGCATEGAPPSALGLLVALALRRRR